jgi:serine/threonine-protein kinase
LVDDNQNTEPDSINNGLDILIVDSDEEVFQEIKKLYKSSGTIFFSTNVEGALTILEQKENIGIVLSDVKLDSEDVTDLIIALKYHHPLIQTIITTRVSDSEIMQKLINNGQIFRVLFKPLLPNSTEKTLQGAVKKYHELVKQPALLKRYQVEAHDSSSVVHTRVRILSQRLAKKLMSVFGYRTLTDAGL